MNYLYYTVEDFVLDKEFREWVIKPNRESNQYWQNWLEKHPEKREVVRQAVEIILNLPVKQFEITEEEIKEISMDLERSIERYEASSADLRPKEIPLNARVISSRQDKVNPGGDTRKWFFVAATVVLATLFGYYLSRISNFTFPEKVTDKTKLTAKENPKGRKSTLFLSDGSKIILNAASKISFPHPFEEDLREVYLEGEAFFEIEKDENRPFRVVTQSMTTTVLGTSFNVRAYTEDQDIRVSLTTGKVEINKLDQIATPQILSPGEQLIYLKSEDTFRKTKFDLNEVVAWKDNILFFRDANEATVIKRLEYWYNVDIKVLNRSPKTWAINAAFDNKPLESVLRTLSYTMNFDFSIEGTEVTIAY